MTRVIHSLWPWTPDSGCAATAEPDVVTGLTATPSGTTTINLVWDADTTAAPNQASEYEVWRSTNGSAPWTQIATVSAPTLSYSDTSLSAGTTRHYYIIARNCFDSANASTSASATTAAGSIGPSWSLDFSTGTPSGYTLTRASTGTYVDSSGYIASASANDERLTHNSSGSRLGLLVEGQRTNILQQSNSFSAAVWPANNTTLTASATTSPDGTTNAWRLVETSATGEHIVSQQPANQTNVCISVFAKANQRTAIGLRIYEDVNEWIQCTFDLSAGTAGTVQAGSLSPFTSTSATITDVGNGWYRCELRGSRSVSGVTFHAIDMVTSATPTLSSLYGSESYAGNTANGVYIWGAQMEAVNSRASSYIPTTTASVTRSADLVHVLDSAVTNWGDPGALVVHFYPPLDSGTLISTDDASTAQVGIEASTTTAARAFWSSGSTATGTIGTGVQKAVHYWNGSTSKFCINGGTVQSGTNNLTIGNADFVTLGAEATESGGVPGTFSQYANCVIRKVEFYSGTLTDSQLQAIT